MRTVRRDFADGESFVTQVGETLELLLSDGTSIVLAEESEVTVSTFSFSRETGAGSLALEVARGLVRVSGGTLNNRQAIAIETPFGAAALTNGIAVVEIGVENADLTLVLGEALETSSSGRAASATGGGSVIRLGRDGDVATTNVSSARMREITTRLNPGLDGGAVPVLVDEGGSRAGDSADRAVREAGLMAQGAPTPSLPVASGFGGGFEQTRPVGDPNRNGAPGLTSAQGWAWSFRRDIEPLDVEVDGDGGLTVRPQEGQQDGQDYPPRDPPIQFGPEGNSTARLYDNSDNPYYQGLPDAFLAATDKMFFVIGTGDVDFPDDFAEDLSPLDLATRLWLFDPDAPVTVDDEDPLRDAGFFLGWVGQPYSDTSGRGCGSRHNTSSCIEAAYTFNLTGEDSFFDARPGDDIPLVADRTEDNINGLGPCDSDSCATFWGLHAGFDVDPVQVSVTMTSEFVANENGPIDTFAVCFGEGRCTDDDPEAVAYAAMALNRTGREPRLSEFFADLADPDPPLNEDSPPIITTRIFELAQVQPGRDHFLYIEGTAADPDTELFMYATGFASGIEDQSASTQFSVDRFSVSAGLSFSNRPTRAFLAPSETFPLQPYDSELWVVNPSSDDDPPATSRMLHADFALGQCPGGQCSTISLSLGTLDYDTESGAGARGRTIASTRGYPDDEVSERILATDSAWASAVAGGGNPVLEARGRASSAGYLVLDNYFPGTDYMGGTERAIADGSAPSQFAITRLASAVESFDAEEFNIATRSTGSIVTGGFVSGFVDRDDAGNTGLRTITSSSDGVVLTANAADSTLSGTLHVAVEGVSSELQVGGAYESTYLNSARYGAFAGAEDGPAAAALVSAAMVIAGWEVADLEPAPGEPAPPEYRFAQAVRDDGHGARHLQWGFFFGDFTTSPSEGAGQPGSTVPWHAHLVPWVGGQVTRDNAPLPTGEVTYGGYAVGNVLSDDRTYSVVGSYSNTWNFASRRGVGTLDFDENLYPVRTEMSDGNAQFSGFLLDPVDDAATANMANSFGPQSGGLTGTFLQADSDTHAGMAGSFSINRESGAYQAAGVFGAER